MEKTIKVTKKMVLGAVAGYFEESRVDEVIAVIDGIEVTAGEIVDYCAKTIAQLDAKAVKAKEYAAKKKVKSDELKDEVAKVLTNEPQTREDILANFDAEDITLAKVGARLTALVKEGTAVKEEIKTVTGKKMGYKLA